MCIWHCRVLAASSARLHSVVVPNLLAFPSPLISSETAISYLGPCSSVGFALPALVTDQRKATRVDSKGERISKIELMNGEKRINGIRKRYGEKKRRKGRKNSNKNALGLGKNKGRRSVPFYSKSTKSVGAKYRWNAEKPLCTVAKLQIFIQLMLRELYSSTEES